MELRRGDLRVATVMYWLTTASRSICRDALAPQPGFALHGIEQYGAADREEAARIFGIGADLGVMGVVADSPAARAGLRADDHLIAVNGKSLPAAEPATAAPTNVRVEAARGAILAAMRNGEVALLVVGVGGQRTVQFTAEKGCNSVVELVPGTVVNASADGRRVVVSAGLLERCGTDADLALVIAHELAHNVLHHAARLARVGIAGANGFLHATAAGTAEMRATEEEADQMGVRLAQAAGYDLGGAASFLSRLQGRDGAEPLSSTHPAPARRVALLAAAIAKGAHGN
jgi:membrane-associated protease RseP (regulator of RpoE activity)